MARNYQHVHRSASRSRLGSPRLGSPRWVWFMAGLTLGLGMTITVHLHHTRIPDQPLLTERTVSGEKTVAANTAESPRSPLRFEFYELLPDSEQAFFTAPKDRVEVNEKKETRVSIQEKPNKPTPKQAKPRYSQPQLAQSQLSAKPQPQTSLQKSAQYFIQAGAFRESRQADRLRAELALLGLEAQIEHSANWHRVRLGPYKDKARLAADKRRLPGTTKALVYEAKS